MQALLGSRQALRSDAEILTEEPLRADQTMYHIRQHGDPILKCQAFQVENIDGSLIAACAAMFEKMRESDGIGLAATQVGILRRFFVFDLQIAGSDADKFAAVCGEMKIGLMINPIISAKYGKSESEEGCLSLPCEPQKILRAEKIEIEALNVDGEKTEIEAEGLFSFLIQHETDHLDGMLIADRLPRSERMKLLRSL